MKYESKGFELPTWDTSGPCWDQDTKFAEARVAESIEIAGAPINLFPLLGLHNQGSTVDLTGNGWPLSSGAQSGSNALDAFNTNPGSWKSVQIGNDVLTSFLGYDFGTVKNATGTYDRYSNHTPNRFHVRTIKITQGAASVNRVRQIRVERSDDGVTWTRVDVVNLPDTDAKSTIRVRASAPARAWRIVPTMFFGSASDFWEIQEVELLEETQTSLDDIEDPVLLENRDRQYSKTSVRLKANFDLIDVQTELSRFGIDIPAQYLFSLSFDVMVSKLGRPIVIGDIIEVPTEAQYDHNLNAVKKWLEVTDTTWSTEGYTANWHPTIYRVTAQPLLASVENIDILGSLNSVNELSDQEFMENNFGIVTETARVTEEIQKEASAEVPLTGEDGTDIQRDVVYTNKDGSEQLIPQVSPTSMYQQDALPPNNLPYTEGEAFPPTPTDGDYHRLTYPVQLKIPARLFQWSSAKRRWIFKEMDNRSQYSSHKPSMSRILASKSNMNITE